MARNEKTKREWYSVSYTTGALFGLTGLLVIGIFSYRQLDLDSLENRADRAIAEATEGVEASREVPSFNDSPDLSKAEGLLDEAVEAFDEGDFQRALVIGDRCLVALAGLESRGGGSIRVLSTQGSVQYRRSEQETWRRLRAHETLMPGDWVKTSKAGAAELYRKDGSVFTLRRDTMIQVRSRDGTTNVHSGGVKVLTSASDSTVTTLGSRARVRRDSEALVSFDHDSRSGRFVVLNGGLEVTAESGATRVVNARQQVDLSRGGLSEIRGVPGQPMIAGPADDHAIELDKENEVKLVWKPVDNARRYALKVSGNRLFSDTFIDHRQAKTSARIGVRREGQFFWQVAALDRRGYPGHWSRVRSFRARSARYAEQVTDREPPPLKIVSLDTLGNLVILSGKTEPGASVTVNGRPETVRSNGMFQAMHEVEKTGRVRLEVVATDAWGNRTRRQVEVFIDDV